MGSREMLLLGLIGVGSGLGDFNGVFC